jgi:hypothetical protein
VNSWKPPVGIMRPVAIFVNHVCAINIVHGKSANRRLGISLGEHATFFQAEVYAILACVHEIENQDRPEKYELYLL